MIDTLGVDTGDVCIEERLGQADHRFVVGRRWEKPRQVDTGCEHKAGNGGRAEVLDGKDRRRRSERIRFRRDDQRRHVSELELSTEVVRGRGVGNGGIDPRLATAGATQ